MKVLVQFSGGKDSQACLIYACEKFGPDNVTAVFCDTGWEHHVTYQHVKDVVALLCCNLKILRNEKLDGMKGLCKRMKWFPDTRRRMCTVYLKIQPFIDYVLSLDDDLLIIQGIRAEESVSRAKMSCSGDYFDIYKNGGTTKSLYQKNKVLDWCANHTATVDRPFFKVLADDIVSYIISHGQDVNTLYRRGCSRVGCYPCIMARKSELQILAKEPEYVERLLNLEMTVNELRGSKKGSPASFFPRGKIPGRFCKAYGRDIPAFKDILNYLETFDNPTFFDDEFSQQSCLSVYHGLCE